ncbi:putative MFS family arabinose efflux permease [Algoriphagus boseongensis]|uniref:Putative MFS family arabinose efflux permease n=1 Tax=Algoriphagus boseongensis TaxID=1442587 RepID=A0A4R6TBQ5_9BACT|nr:MFS transporter [Algoriphagus boseongensis]TDQ19472.1 putative MFS family arabinose efflux permease [Algoriphagus boseongensis]
MDKPGKFSSYQKLVILGLACLLFTVVLDYMLLPALSGILLYELQLTTQQFGLITSAYALSAGISALLASGYADRFERKSFLLVFYGGFLFGILLCALSPSFPFLLAARVLTGAFGGVMASICFAMVADLFPLSQRGRVTGWIQMAFAASLVIGLPLSLFIASSFSWQMAYGLILSLGILALLMVVVLIRPLGDSETGFSTPWVHIISNLKKPTYWIVYSANLLIVGGDVIFMTFNAAFLTNNLGLDDSQLPYVYGAVGLTSLLAAPIFGKLADSFGKWPIFAFGTLLSIGAVVVYTAGVIQSFEWIILMHVGLYMGINARMVSATALTTAVPKKSDRGAFLAIDSSIQQVAGGLAAALAGLVIFQTENGSLLYYPQIGWLMAILMLLSSALIFLVSNQVKVNSKSEES